MASTNKQEWEVSMAGSLLGMGNPLLDMSTNVDKDFLETYGLTPGDIIMAEKGDKYQPIFKDVPEREGVKYIAGGATQNSIRVCQWMLQKKNATAYMGCIGKDAHGDKLKAACSEAGVTSYYLVDEAVSTGVCAALILDKERTLVTDLGAANCYKVDHLKNAEHTAVLEKAKVVYSAGFFMTVCPDAMEMASKHCNETGKPYCLNLSAPFLMEVPPFKAVLEKLLPRVDFLFGNETEADVFAKTWGWSETSVPDIAKKMAALPKEGSRSRTVVITQGTGPTVVCVSGEVTEYPIIRLPPQRVRDTNGAGDAYVGGFLSGLVQDKDMHYCCQAGAYAASCIVQRSGCTTPPKPRFTYRPESAERFANRCAKLAVSADVKPLRKPRFGVVAKIMPEGAGVNLMVKVVKQVGAAGDFTEFVVGDKTGVVTFSATEDQKALFADGAVLRIQNAKVIMVKGFIRVVADKWGKVAAAAADTPGGLPEIEVSSAKDVSATEYELTQ